MTLLNLRWLAGFTAVYLFLLPTNHGTYLRSIAFGGSILFTAFATIGGMLIVNGLPMHYHPVLKYDHIRRGMDDTFFIVIEARDPRYHAANTKALLEKAGGKEVKEIEA